MKLTSDKLICILGDALSGWYVDKKRCERKALLWRWTVADAFMHLLPKWAPGNWQSDINPKSKRRIERSQLMKNALFFFFSPNVYVLNLVNGYILSDLCASPLEKKIMLPGSFFTYWIQMKTSAWFRHECSRNLIKQFSAANHLRFNGKKKKKNLKWKADAEKHHYSCGQLTEPF